MACEIGTTTVCSSMASSMASVGMTMLSGDSTMWILAPRRSSAFHTYEQVGNSRLV